MPFCAKLTSAVPSGPVVAPPTVAPGLRRAGQAVDDGERHALSGGRGPRAAQAQDRRGGEVLIREQHVLAAADALPATPDLREGPVDEERRVVVGIDRVRADAQEGVVVVEARVPAGIPREAGLAGRVVEGADGGGPGGAADARAVAGPRHTVGRRRHRVNVGDHRSLEDRLGRPLDSEVDRDRRGRGGRRRGQGEQDQRRLESASGCNGHGATLSSRVVWAGRSEVSWLGAPRRAFPVSGRLTSGSLRRIGARSQWRDRAGFTPDFPQPPAE